MGCDYYSGRAYSIKYSICGVEGECTITRHERRWIYEDSEDSHEKELRRRLERKFFREVSLESAEHLGLIDEIKDCIIKSNDSLHFEIPGRNYPLKEKYSTITEEQINNYKNIHFLIYNSYSTISSDIKQKIESEILEINYNTDIIIISNIALEYSYPRN